MMNAKMKLLFLVLLASSFASASSTTTKQIDTIKNSSGGSSLTVPSTGSTFDTDTNANTLQNKVISGSNNTLSQLPIATQMIQAIVTPYPNGSTTAFTLGTAPGASVGVQIFLDGVFEFQGSGKDYTISGSTITFTVAPETGQRIIGMYSQY